MLIDGVNFRIELLNHGKDGEVTLERHPLPWQEQGLQETASGYGAKLTTVWKARFDGRLYRVYCTIYSNNGTCWFVSKGRKYIVG
jgi:hypothetical protein